MVSLDHSSDKNHPLIGLRLVSNHFSDDPYYAGLRARIPNFAKSKAQKEKEREALYARLPAHSQPKVSCAILKI